ncbi:ImmA/IrrE family metallo-endopeptidase [Glaciimonas sp. PCH181]|uniref:ImmA/IrrE family metallo-endopeptidase n=1 Tax=Glaciimonas sp. PCH181 TaxID=2133943 RepID=UPI000D349FCA|nr:ImmA/IrrE family metallo-endopeptidase [Glaciimonas sp. PCH181]PUA16806.1 hypothetical protein C7W93_22760 [Glaciimonas sp. PCH181]
MKQILKIPQLLNLSALNDFLKEKRDYDLFENAPPIAIDTVAELLGIEVNDTPSFDLEDLYTVGKITLAIDQPAKIWINPMENSYTPRRRFTLAHEIGHFCMHRSDNQMTFVDTKATMNRSESFWNRHESEANTFAAELLMPATLIRSVGRKVIDLYKVEQNVEKMPMANFIEQMAVRFKVSNPAMEYRLKNLGIRAVKTPANA